MKKIVCIVFIIALLVLNYGATVFAETTDNPSNPTTESTPYNDYVIGELKDGYKLCYNTIPGPPWMEAFYVQYDKYVFVNFLCEGEKGHGFFVVKGDEKLMLSEAFDKGITDIEEVVDIITDKDITSSNPVCVVDTEKVEGNWKDLFMGYHFSQDDNSTEPHSSESQAAQTTETQSVTDKPTESTETEPVTDKATEPTSDLQIETTETQPVTDKPTEPTETPTDDPTQAPTETVSPIEAPTTVTQPTQPTVKAKKANLITVKVKTKTVKVKMIEAKKQTVKAITVKNAKGKVTYKIKSASKKIKKLVKISSKGVISIKRWKKAKKGIYKIKVKITAKGNMNYNCKTITKTVKIKIK